VESGTCFGTPILGAAPTRQSFQVTMPNLTLTKTVFEGDRGPHLQGFRARSQRAWTQVGGLDRYTGPRSLAGRQQFRAPFWTVALLSSRSMFFGQGAPRGKSGCSSPSVDKISSAGSEGVAARPEADDLDPDREGPPGRALDELAVEVHLDSAQRTCIRDVEPRATGIPLVVGS